MPLKVMAVLLITHCLCFALGSVVVIAFAPEFREQQPCYAWAQQHARDLDISTNPDGHGTFESLWHACLHEENAQGPR